jgi:hypothetical protein
VNDVGGTFGATHIRVTDINPPDPTARRPVCFRWSAPQPHSRVATVVIAGEREVRW